jgi:hypothetical protein
MSEPADILHRIQDGVAQNPDPLPLIEQLAARTPADAIQWARRLPLWDDFRGQYPGNVVAVARLISRRAMKEFRLVFDAEGRVVEEKEIRPGVPEPRPTTFPLQIGDETVEVRYTHDYLPNAALGLFSFAGEKLPGDNHPMAAHKPHALSGTGWRSHYASRDAVEACGGPERFAALYAEARLKGEDERMDATLNGVRPVEKVTRRGAAPAVEKERAVVGQHTAKVVQAEPSGRTRHVSLFD